MKPSALLCALLTLSPVLQAQVYKCADPKTGNITFSDGACASAHRGAAVRLNPANSMDSSEDRRAMYKLEEQQYESQQSDKMRSSNTNNYQRRSSDPLAEQARKEAYRSASTPYKGANGLTANQLRTLAALGGVNVPAPKREYSQNSVVNQPRVVTNCDESGCWDTQGGRYNRGAGNTYIPTTGGSCQGVGNQMQCN